MVWPCECVWWIKLYTRNIGRRGRVDADRDETRCSRGPRQPIAFADCGPTRARGGGNDQLVARSGAVPLLVPFCRCHCLAAWSVSLSTGVRSVFSVHRDIVHPTRARLLTRQYTWRAIKIRDRYGRSSSDAREHAWCKREGNKECVRERERYAPLQSAILASFRSAMLRISVHHPALLNFVVLVSS